MASRLLVDGAASAGKARPLAHVVRKIGSSSGALKLILAVVIIFISLALGLSREGECSGHRLHRHHLNQDFFGILKSLEQ